MRWPSTRSWRWRGWGFGAGAVVGVGLKLVGELAGNGAFGKLGWVLLVLSVAGGLALDRLNDRRRTREPTEDPVPPPNIPLPPPVDLLGRESAVRAVVGRLCRQGVTLVHGAGGMGSSAVAIEAARQVVADQDRQHYVDLRGQNPRKPDGARRVALRVLTTLGLDQGLSRNLDPVGRAVRDALRDSGRLLMIDNVTR
ncbi:MAG TPA: hypothetical protein VFX70_20235, partial [Mycobacteriales bacterium]|nr:hypothetical protein [Mycobacteriales bacterium]